MRPEPDPAAVGEQSQAESPKLTLEQALALPDEELRERVAEIAGWRGPYQKEWLRDYGPEGEDEWHYCGTDPEGERDKFPEFHASHDALTPVIAGLSDVEMYCWIEYMLRILGRLDRDCDWEDHAVAIERALPRQKCVVLILAKQMNHPLPTIPTQGPTITAEMVEEALEDETTEMQACSPPDEHGDREQDHRDRKERVLAERDGEHCENECKNAKDERGSHA